MPPTCFFRHLLALLVLALLTLPGCQNYRDQLQRGQGYYEQNQYETAMAVWRNLEPDQTSLSEAEIVRYCYLRGMTDYRLGYPKHARYWLGLAKAGDNESQSALLPDENERLRATLEELNREVYGPAYASSLEEASAKSCSQGANCDEGASCEDGFCVSSE